MSGSIDSLFRLDGLSAVVTGASSGLGVEFARALAEAGADVALGARRVDQLAVTAKLVTDAGGRAYVAHLDVADPDACEGFVEGARVELGRIDILVNNAGIADAAPATREDPDSFRRIVDINLNGSYWMAQSVARAMEGGGSIINVSSVLGLKTAGLPQAAYSASKAALFGLTRDLAQQWTGRRGIRVNALVPGFFQTDMTEKYADGYLEAQVERLPAGRLGDARELAAAAVFLASPASGYMTGSTLVLDGGFTIV